MTDERRTSLTEQELDALVEQIKAPIQNLEGLEAELVMAHSYFEVVTSCAIFDGLTTPEEVLHRISGSFMAFIEANPMPPTH